MKRILRVVALFVAVPLALGLFQVRDAAGDIEKNALWKVKKEMRRAVDAFRSSSPIVEDMYNNNIPNEPVYIPEWDDDVLFPIYDLFACINMTNPQAKMEVDSGGGFDVTINNVKFVKGSWPVVMRIYEIEQIHLLDKHMVYILKKIQVGTLTFTSPAEMVQIIKELTAKCF